MTIKLTLVLPPWDEENWKPTIATVLIAEGSLILGPIDNFRQNAYLLPNSVTYVTIRVPGEAGNYVQAAVTKHEYVDEPVTPPTVDIDTIINPCICVQLTELTYVQVINQE